MRNTGLATALGVGVGAALAASMGPAGWATGLFIGLAAFGLTGRRRRG